MKFDAKKSFGGLGKHKVSIACLIFVTLLFASNLAYTYSLQQELASVKASSNILPTPYYTGNPFGTELYSGQLQAENITGMHYYTWLSGALQNRTDTMAFPEQSASYIIFKSGSSLTYTSAKNGATGQIDWNMTDASTVINLVITATSSGLIFIKAGTYFITSTILVTANIYMEGEGGFGAYQVGCPTKLVLADHVNDDLLRSYHYNTAALDNGITIKNMEFNGNKNEQNAGSCIKIASKDALLEDLYVHHGYDYGIEIVGISGSVVSNRWKITRGTISNCGNAGICIGNYAYDGTMLDVQAGDSQYYQIVLAPHSGPCRLISPHVWSSWVGSGILIQSALIRIIDPELEMVKQNGIVIQATNLISVDDTQIIGGEIRDAGYGTDNTYDAIILIGYSSLYKVNNTLIDGLKIFSRSQTNSPRYGINENDTYISGTKIRNVEVRDCVTQSIRRQTTFESMVYLLPIWGNGNTNQVGTVRRVHLVPMYVPLACIVDEIDFNLAVLSTGNFIRACIYADNGGTPAGGALLFDSGDISTNATGAKNIAVPDLSLGRGLVWVGLATNDATMAFVRTSSTAFLLSGAKPMMEGCYYTLGTWGALTATCPTVTQWASSRAVILLHVKALNE